MSTVTFSYDDDFPPEPTPEQVAEVSRFVATLLPSGTIAKAVFAEMAGQAGGEQR